MNELLKYAHSIEYLLHCKCFRKEYELTIGSGFNRCISYKRKFSLYILYIGT